jgi:hypothetical protein
MFSHWWNLNSAFSVKRATSHMRSTTNTSGPTSHTCGAGNSTTDAFKGPVRYVTLILSIT